MADFLNYKFIVSYDGGSYCGWQYQPRHKSVQEVIEGSIEDAFKMAKGSVKINGSGRTDAGVHALGQVFSVKLPNIMSCEKMIWLFNRFLPEDICIEDCKVVDDSFHGRFSAISKTYMYRIYLSSKKNSFESGRSWHYFKDFDLELANEMLGMLVGVHDFAAFMSSGSDKTDTVRNIYEAYMVKSDCRNSICNRGEMLEIYFRGNGFLYNMVRNMVGLISEVANGRISPEKGRALMEGGIRTKEIITAPAHGLYLVNVEYGD